MSAINGLRIILSCENVIGAFVQNGLRAGNNGGAANLCTDITINDPTFFLNIVRVDSTVDQQLIASAKKSRRWEYQNSFSDLQFLSNVNPHQLIYL